MPEDETIWTSSTGETISIISDVELSDREYREVINSRAEFAAMRGWIKSVHSESASRAGSSGILARDKYVTPEKIFDVFKVAREAVRSDDVVSNVVDTTESLVFNNMRVECGDPDEENIWTQILHDINLDARIREMWRELFTYNQFYVAQLFANKTYKVEGKKNSRAARKEFKVDRAPRALSILDPLKVIPVGDFLFGQNQLVYIANRGEGARIDETLAGSNTTDQVVSSLIMGRYNASREERRLLSEMTGAGYLDDLFLLNPALVWRHTGTTSSYNRFADVPIASVFELLDLKNQLKNNDRTLLIANTNFIVLIRKGSEKEPATNAELGRLSQSAQMIGRSPLIIGDHRLTVDIIAPNADFTLDPKRYNTLDSRITARLYQLLHLGSFSAGASGDDSLKLIRVIARGLEARRKMIKDSIERNLLIPVFEQNDSLKNRPSLEFIPRNVSLDFDPNFLQTMMDLYMNGSISRETILGVVDHDQEVEFTRRTLEKKLYDKTMEPRPMSNAQAGATMGGEKQGGGTNPDSNKPNPGVKRSSTDTPAGSTNNQTKKSGNSRD